MDEIWLDLKGYENLYKISNLGNIKSFQLNKKGKLLRPSKDKDGYKQVGIRDINSKRKWFRLHRLVALHFIPNPNNYDYINHKDNTPDNNVYTNLEWCTLQYNNQYRFDTGRACNTGSNHPQASLTEDQAKQIYILGHNGDYTELELAKKFNTTRSVVNKVRLKYNWTHVTADL